MRAGSAGAPPHRHRRSAELFYVLDGALDVLLEDRIVTLERGDLLVVPAGTTHAFAPPADRDADVLFVFTPGTARSDYYRLLDRAHRGEAEWAEIAESSERFDNHYVESAALGGEVSRSPARVDRGRASCCFIGAPRFELGTSPTRTVRATRLRHAPRRSAV